MKTNALLSSMVLATVVFPAMSLADEMDDCMNEEARKMAEVISFTTSEQGCQTKATGGDGRRHTCDSTVCYKAPPGWTIKGQVSALDHSNTGSEHSISAVTYEYNSYGQTEKACVNVHARGPHGYFTGRGWQNVKLTGETEKVTTQDALKQAAKFCAKKTRT